MKATVKSQKVSSFAVSCILMAAITLLAVGIKLISIAIIAGGLFAVATVLLLEYQLVKAEYSEKKNNKKVSLTKQANSKLVNLENHIAESFSAA